MEISPSEVASVCQEGDQLEITCNTDITVRFLRWEFTVRLENGAPMTIMPQVSSGGSSGVTPPITINSTTFTFSRLSTQPLTSRMTISSVSEDMNGVQVNCVDIEVPGSPATTAIRIINEGRKCSAFGIRTSFFAWLHTHTYTLIMHAHKYTHMQINVII